MSVSSSHPTEFVAASDETLPKDRSTRRSQSQQRAPLHLGTMYRIMLQLVENVENLQAHVSFALWQSLRILKVEEVLSAQKRELLKYQDALQAHDNELQDMKGAVGCLQQLLGPQWFVLPEQTVTHVSGCQGWNEVTSSPSPRNPAEHSLTDSSSCCKRPTETETGALCTPHMGLTLHSERSEASQNIINDLKEQVAMLSDGENSTVYYSSKWSSRSPRSAGLTDNEDQTVPAEREQQEENGSENEETMFSAATPAARSEPSESIVNESQSQAANLEEEVDDLVIPEEPSKQVPTTPIFAVKAHRSPCIINDLQTQIKNLQEKKTRPSQTSFPARSVVSQSSIDDLKAQLAESRGEKSKIGQTPRSARLETSQKIINDLQEQVLEGKLERKGHRLIDSMYSDMHVTINGNTLIVEDDDSEGRTLHATAKLDEAFCVHRISDQEWTLKPAPGNKHLDEFCFTWRAPDVDTANKWIMALQDAIGGDDTSRSLSDQAAGG